MSNHSSSGRCHPNNKASMVSSLDKFTNNKTILPMLTSFISNQLQTSSTRTTPVRVSITLKPKVTNKIITPLKEPHNTTFNKISPMLTVGRTTGTGDGRNQQNKLRKQTRMQASNLRLLNRQPSIMLML